MNQEAIYHEAFGAYAFPLGGHRLKIRLRAKKGDLQSVAAVHEDRHPHRPGADLGIVPMEKVGSTMLHDIFEAVLHSKTRRVKYWFHLSDGTHSAWYGERGFAESRMMCPPFHYAYITEKDLFDVPDWIDDGIVYQIFPERFANGDPSNDPEDVQPWGGEPEGYNFFGGDLAGITKKLDYLSDLGINVIYMTPVFLSPSNHKYNTTDYYQIDPQFGTLEDLKELVRQAHALGIRVIMDAVFNHCGSDFFAFQDVIANGKKSPYWDWFFIEDEPVTMKPLPNYETFASYVYTMPKLNTAHPDVKAYLLDVARYWIEEADIDGWRLDVSNEVDAVFWREFRQVVKKAKPEALIIGEVWHHSGPWLQGDQYDSVMNYWFKEAMEDFFAKQTIGVEAFHALLVQTQTSYKDQANRGMFNLIDSHDTARFLTACQEKEERFKLAVLFQLAYPGMPMIYYGDEIGMKGATDPLCRGTFVWEEEGQNADILSWYKTCIRLRRTIPALRTGNYRLWYMNAPGNVYAIVRGTDSAQPAGVLLNNSALRQKLSIPVAWMEREELTDRLTGRTYPITDGQLHLEVEPYQGFVFV